MAHDTAKPNQKVTWGLQPALGAPSGSDHHNNNEGTYFLGRYRIVDEIGVGGMASVHLARLDGDGGFQRWVAIKKMHPHLIEDDSFVQMFLDEARVAARISHPNVAAVLELGKHEETYWIAMEYLHGEPLREVMRRSEEMGQIMPCDVACRVVADAAEGLHAAHELVGRNGEQLGLVHRDVTPHNLFVSYDGVTKVVDFGIAKFHARMATTRAGTLKGKLAYMSPEQIRDQPLDRRTDVFALGVVLWEITTGQRLFRSDNDIDTIAKVQECIVPRPTTILPGYPVDLEKIVMKALAKNRNERFKSAHEMSRALQMLLMKRGVFVGSDEISTYMRDTFKDRIQKRDAHLRWAAEVTKTIDIATLDTGNGGIRRHPSKDDSTFNSDVQPANGAPKIRPAAGAPPVQTGISGTPQMMAQQHVYPHMMPPPQAPQMQMRPHSDYPSQEQGPDGEQPTVMTPYNNTTSGSGSLSLGSLPAPTADGSVPLDLSTIGQDPNEPLVDDDQDETIVAAPKQVEQPVRSRPPPAPPRPKSGFPPRPEPRRADAQQRGTREGFQARGSSQPLATSPMPVQNPAQGQQQSQQASAPQQGQGQQHNPGSAPPWDPGSQNQRLSSPDFSQQIQQPPGRGAFDSSPQYAPDNRNANDALAQPQFVHHSGNYPYAPPPAGYPGTARVAVRRRPPAFVIGALGFAGAVLLFSVVMIATQRPPDPNAPGPGESSPLEDVRRGFLQLAQNPPSSTSTARSAPSNAPPTAPMATLLVSCSPSCTAATVNGTPIGAVGDAPIAVAVPAGKRSVVKFRRNNRDFDEFVVPEANTQVPVRKR